MKPVRSFTSNKIPANGAPLIYTILIISILLIPLPDTTTGKNEKETSIRGETEPSYHTYSQVIQELENITQLHPGITVLHDLSAILGVPLTHQNRSLMAVQVTNLSMQPDKPAILITGCHHAREWISVEVPLFFLGYLVDNYGKDPYVTYLVNNRDIWIIPVVNPDGYIKSWDQNDRDNNHTGWRKNCRDNNGDGLIDDEDGVDLNRNYGYMWGYDDVGSSGVPSNRFYRGPEPFSEPETQAIQALCSEIDFGVVLEYHSWQNSIIYPFAYTEKDTSDNDDFSMVAIQMNRYNGYIYGNCRKSPVFYKCNGEATDWHYSMKNSLALTIELGGSSDGFIPDESRILPICQENLPVNLLACDIADQPWSSVILADPEDDYVTRVIWQKSMLGNETSGNGSWELIPGEGPGWGFWQAGNDSIENANETNVTTSILTLELRIGETEEERYLTFWERYDLTDDSVPDIVVIMENGSIESIPGFVTDDGEKSSEDIHEREGVRDWKRALYNLTPYTSLGNITVGFAFNQANNETSDHWDIDKVMIRSSLPYDPYGEQGEPFLPFTLQPDLIPLRVSPGGNISASITLHNLVNRSHDLSISLIGDTSDAITDRFTVNFTVQGEKTNTLDLQPLGSVEVNISIEAHIGLIPGWQENIMVEFRSTENVSNIETLMLQIEVESADDSNRLDDENMGLQIAVMIGILSVTVIIIVSLMICRQRLLGSRPKS